MDAAALSVFSACVCVCLCVNEEFGTSTIMQKRAKWLMMLDVCVMCVR